MKCHKSQCLSKTEFCLFRTLLYFQINGTPQGGRARCSVRQTPQRTVLRKSSRRQYLLVLPAGKYHSFLGKLTGEDRLFLKRLARYLLIHIRQLECPLYFFPILFFARMSAHESIFFNGIGKNFSVLESRGKQVPLFVSKNTCSNSTLRIGSSGKIPS